MTARDEANNSRISRRFVIYDPVSNISLNSNDKGKLFVSSADEDNGYQWQTKVSGKYVLIFNWPAISRNLRFLYLS